MIRYFTGLEAEWIPSFTGYTRTTYNPSRQGFLLAKRRVDEEFLWSFYEQFQEACKSTNRSLPIPELISLRNRYPSYRYSDLAAHQGIMHLSYQVSTMSIFEQYRMNIPLFFHHKSYYCSGILHAGLSEKEPSHGLSVGNTHFFHIQASSMFQVQMTTTTQKQ